VGVSREQQILEDYTSMHAKIPAEFWVDLKNQSVIEQNAKGLVIATEGGWNRPGVES
jgi:hypothetical protein